MTTILSKRSSEYRILEARETLDDLHSARREDSSFWSAPRSLRYFPEIHPGTEGHPRQPGLWPTRWISAVAATREAIVAAYRLKFSLPSKTRMRLHITADERYEFFIDGRAAGVGPERGDEKNWFFESYELELAAGDHTFVARVSSLGEKAPFAQISLGHGFFLCPDDARLIPLLGTGLGGWQTKILSGYQWVPPLSCTWGTGWNQVTDGTLLEWGHESGDGSSWINPHIGAFGDSAEAVRNVSLQKGSIPHHRLRPAMLPPMLDEIRHVGKVRHISSFAQRPVGLEPIRRTDHLSEEASTWQHLLEGGDGLIVPPHSTRRVVIDLEDYFCGRPLLTVSGGDGGSVEIDWTEALYENIDIPEDCECIEGHVWPKGDRNEIEGKFFVCPWFRKDGPGDIFRLDGGEHRTFSTLWWQSGRYLQILVETKDAPLTIESLALRETRYPLEMEGRWRSSDARLNATIPPMLRTIQMCAHETYMDCPFYEQLMYAGDTRLQILATYVLTTDDHLPRKALQIFDWSRLQSGLTQSRYPARVRQIIPPFSLWWVAMCHDYALWRGDPDFVRSLLPGVRSVCDYFAMLIDEHGVLQSPDGWNFTDWAPGWTDGVPPGAAAEPSAALHWQAALVLRYASELETWFGEPEIAALQHRRATTIAAAADRLFWDEDRGLYADDLAHERWSEHAQCLAILSDLVPATQRERLNRSFLAATDLTPTTIYFSHYLFETYQKLGQPDALLQRLGLWHSLADLGLRTTIESPEPSRSDCHGWGAHPLYHFYATLAGIRPAGPGFTEVTIQPQPGSLTELDAVLPHPRGQIHLRIHHGKTTIELPVGVALAKSESLKLNH